MSKPRAEPHLCKKQNGTTNHPTPGYQRDWFADGKKEIKSCISTLLKLSEEGDPPSSMVEPGYLHSSLPVPTMPGFCAPHPMMEYTYTPRAPSITLKGACPAYSSIFPAMPACQRHSKASKLWGARARDGMENIASERRLFWGFASETRTASEGIIIVLHSKAEEVFQLITKKLSVQWPWLYSSIVLFPPGIIMCFTSLNYCSHKWNNI